jgi:hypothetical protein
MKDIQDLFFSKSFSVEVNHNNRNPEAVLAEAGVEESVGYDPGPRAGLSGGFGLVSRQKSKAIFRGPPVLPRAPSGAATGQPAQAARKARQRASREARPKTTSAISISHRQRQRRVLFQKKRQKILQLTSCVTSSTNIFPQKLLQLTSLRNLLHKNSLLKKKSPAHLPPQPLALQADGLFRG